MKRTNYLFLLAICAIAVRAQTDYRYDNVVYPTIYAKDLCAAKTKDPRLLLIDVRSPGEFADTSMYSSLNIGHLKGAINISIDSIPKNIPLLKEHINDQIILYCSHSQRSRRVSKMLKDSGFTQVRNLNGGMSWLTQANETEFPCKKEMIVSALPYKSIPAIEMYELLKNNKDAVILDVRPVSEYEGGDTIEILNMGRLKHAINIPYTDIKSKAAILGKNKNKVIFIYDSNGAQSNMAADSLKQLGFTKIYTLLGGMSAIVGKDHETSQARKELFENTPAYNIVNAKEALNLLTANNNLVVFDIRPEEEFNNKSKQPWRNLGHIKNAVNIAPAGFDQQIPTLAKYKASTILVYGNRDAAKCCKKLKAQGFTNVNIVYGGLWDLVSTSFNVEGFSGIRAFIVDHDGFY